MRAFFHGWRRKVGCVTLVMALVFVAGWIRSFVVDDFIATPFKFNIGNWSIAGIATENQSLVLYADSLSEPDLEPGLPVTALANADSKIPDAEFAPQETEPADALSASSESEPVEEWSVVSEGGSLTSFTTVITCTFPSPVPLVRIPFYYVAIPLTLLSAYLILWPGQRPAKQVAEIIPASTGG